MRATSKSGTTLRRVGAVRWTAAAVVTSVALVGARPAVAATAGPQRRAAHPRPSARLGGRSPRLAGAASVVASPEPGSRTASPATQISLLGISAREIGRVTVTGSESGAHAGRLEAYSTGDGASFVPERPFVAGETVTVRTRLPLVGAPTGTFRFVVAHDVALTAAPSRPALRVDVPGVEHFVSAPALQPPRVTVTQGGGGVGDFFLAPKGTTGEAGPMIVRPDGALVWFDPLAHGEAFDLNVQRYHAKPVLTWFQGEVVDGHGEGEDVIASSSYRTLAVVHAGNGLHADLHEFQITPQGTALVTAYEGTRWNLSSMHGSAHGDVLDGIVQEIDIPTGLVMYQWDSLDHVPVTDSYFEAAKSPDVPYDYFHVNSIDQLQGGDLIVSARNTSAAYEISPSEAGKVVWELGGTGSSFTMGAGTRFYFQHDVREVARDRITIFDDGASPPRERESRALVVRIDPATHQATLVKAYLPPSTLLAVALGNVQTLPGGDVVVGWGTTPFYSEYSASGRSLYDAALPRGDDSYREFRYPWTATPTTKPAVVVTSSGAHVVVHASWNGATGVARWRVLSGASAAALSTVTSAADAGFETAMPVGRLGPVVEVEALDSAGRVVGRSAAVAR